MKKDEHTEILNRLTNLLIEKGTHTYDNPIPNCWEAGVLKAITIINMYVQENKTDD